METCAQERSKNSKMSRNGCFSGAIFHKSFNIKYMRKSRGVKKVQFRRRFTTSLVQVYYKFSAVLAQVFVIFGPVFVAKLRARGLEGIGLERNLEKISRVDCRRLVCTLELRGYNLASLGQSYQRVSCLTFATPLRNSSNNHEHAIWPWFSCTVTNRADVTSGQIQFGNPSSCECSQDPDYFCQALSVR